MKRRDINRGIITIKNSKKVDKLDNLTRKLTINPLLDSFLKIDLTNYKKEYYFSTITHLQKFQRKLKIRLIAKKLNSDHTQW
ncbi:MAG: hypothetical protein ACFFAU_10635 [Candidatus Hodarchaeota archaeon]